MFTSLMIFYDSVFSWRSNKATTSHHNTVANIDSYKLDP